MSTFQQGIVIMVVGMGGTLLSLGFLILSINIGKWLLPYQEEEKETAAAVAKERV